MTDLKVTPEQLDGYGKYASEARRIAMFSVANDFEAHGYPMPPHTDSLVTQAWCNRITQKTGASYIAHIPYSTDHMGDIARTWSPSYMPFDEFYSKLKDFVKWHVAHLSFSPEKVVIINGHGGNQFSPEHDDDLSKACGVPVNCLMGGVSEPLIYPEFEAIEAVYEIVAKEGEHAYMLEYSFVAHLGYLDYAKLDVLNEVAANDPLEALRRWPAIAGLGGFTQFGGPEYDPLREVEGFIVAREDFKKRRKLVVDEELGRRASELVVNYFCERMVQV